MNPESLPLIEGVLAHLFMCFAIGWLLSSVIHAIEATARESKSRAMLNRAKAILIDAQARKTEQEILLPAHDWSPPPVDYTQKPDIQAVKESA